MHMKRTFPGFYLLIYSILSIFCLFFLLNILLIYLFYHYISTTFHYCIDIYFYKATFPDVYMYEAQIFIFIELPSPTCICLKPRYLFL